MVVLGHFFRTCLLHAVLRVSVGSPKDFGHSPVKRGTSYNGIDVSRYVAPANAKSTQRRVYSNVNPQHGTTSKKSATSTDLFHAQTGAAHHSYRGLGQQSAYNLNGNVKITECVQSASTYKFPRKKDSTHIESEAVEAEAEGPVSVDLHLYNRKSLSGSAGKSSHIGPVQQSNTPSYILPAGLTKPSLNLYSVSTRPNKYEQSPRKPASPSHDLRQEMIKLETAGKSLHRTVLNQKGIRHVPLFSASAPVPLQNNPKTLRSESSAPVSQPQRSFQPRAVQPRTLRLRFSSPHPRPQGRYQPFQVLSNTSLIQSPSQIAEDDDDGGGDDDDDSQEGSGEVFKSVPTGTAGASVPGLLSPIPRSSSGAGSMLSSLSNVSPSSTWFQVFCGRLNLCSGPGGGNKPIP